MENEDAVGWTKVHPQYSVTSNNEYVASGGPASARVGDRMAKEN